MSVETSDSIQVFIGSSKESKAIVEKVIKKLIIPKAAITPWYDEKFFEPGKTFLETLIQKFNEIDFAILVFGADDKIDTRGKVIAGPRDNVVFEYGLAMGLLGKERTFVLVPCSENNQIKIMSDLAGIKTCDYRLPNKGFPKKFKALDALNSQQKRLLSRALNTPCEHIKESINCRMRKRRTDKYSRPGPSYVTNVYPSIMKKLSKLRKEKPEVRLTVLNLALDRVILKSWG